MHFLASFAPFSLEFLVIFADFWPKFAGRCIVGVGVGCGLAIDPLYISELAPAAHRGRLTSFSETAINVGILLGYLSNLCFMWLDDR